MKRGAAVICAGLLVGMLAARPGHALDLQLQGKTALITGSTAGIGYATAKALLREGAQVIINGRTQASVDRAAAALAAATGHRPLEFAGDMSKAQDIARLTKAFPSVDILINNVGRFVAKDFERTSDQDWYDTFELNVMAGVRLSRDYLPSMRARNWGRIIFISSESALQIPVESIQYGMSKAAEIAVARGLAESVARTGITVNSILPGPTLDPNDPRMAAFARRPGGQSFAQMQENFFKTRRPTSLLQRFERPDEVAALIVFVASPLSSGTTGAALRVDGGVVKSAF
ncbi:MAG TPA: SDR family NAD(P)-dependent oxidoreductase [Steroidobacteraceae bacterium]|nr:SDR family NAD(P)-dependent oxidoreductase [Steroidobacteraceae bacterium]